MRAADNHCLEHLHCGIEARLRFEIGVEHVPLTRRIKRETASAVERPIRDIKTIVIFALQDFAKAGRDTHPPLLINRMVETTGKHSPLPSPIPHNIPLHPTSVKQKWVCAIQ